MHLVKILDTRYSHRINETEEIFLMRFNMKIHCWVSQLGEPKRVLLSLVL